MQINNTQCPTPKSTSFGMALKVKPSAVEFLKSKSNYTLETLEKLGEEIKDYKHWDLLVDDKGYHVVGKYHLDGQYAEIGIPKDDPKFISTYFAIPVKSERFAEAGQTIQKYMNYETHAEATDALSRMLSASSPIDRTAVFIKELEKLSAKKAYEEASKKAAEQEHLGKINDLIGKFRDGE